MDDLFFTSVEENLINFIENQLKNWFHQLEQVNKFLTGNKSFLI